MISKRGGTAYDDTLHIQKMETSSYTRTARNKLPMLYFMIERDKKRDKNEGMRAGGKDIGMQACAQAGIKRGMKLTHWPAKPDEQASGWAVHHYPNPKHFVHALIRDESWLRGVGYDATPPGGVSNRREK